MAGVKPKRFIFTGGGSGGHVSPALAVAAVVKQRYPDAQILYVGVKNKAEGIMVPKAGIPIKFVNSAPFPERSPVKMIKFLFSLLTGMIKAKFILLKFRPDVVFATGGYVSAPIVFTAFLLRKLSFGLFRTKILIHESNVHPGKMNKWAARAADAVAVSFGETIKCLPKGKGFYSGYPVRGSISAGDRKTARIELGIPENAFVILAFGGSQGARTINRALADASKTLLADKDIYIIHGTGKPFGEGSAGYNGYEDVNSRLKEIWKDGFDEKRYIVRDFIDNMGLYYAASDLVIIRAGAGSIMEVCRQAKPSIIIPISGIFSDHQTGNARYIERAGAATVLYEQTDPLNGINIPFVNGPDLAGKIIELKNDPARLSKMAESATGIFPGDPGEIITDYIRYLLKEKDFTPPSESGALVQDRILNLSSTALEQFLKNVRSGSEPELDEDEQRLLFNKLDTYLSSSNVLFRSRALRMAGLCHYDRIVPLILKMAVSPKEKPFVRRDAFDALSMLCPLNKDHCEELFDAIIKGLSDSYYEARYMSAKCARIMAKHMDIDDGKRKMLTDKLAKGLNDHCFEVRVESILALGGICTDGDLFTGLMGRCYYDQVWKVRQAVFAAFEKAVERKIISKTAALVEMDKVLITSDGYLTHYELKQQFNTSRKAISMSEEEQ